MDIIREENKEKKHNKNRRKQRVVKGAYVDIDFVAVQPGTDYCDWIKITKFKLKERESQLLELRIRDIGFLVNNELLHTNKRNNTHWKFVISADIINNTLHRIYYEIDEWDGIDITRRKLKTPLTRYRDYFKRSSNWWDQHKRKILGDTFWINIFKNIQHFVYDLYGHNNQQSVNKCILLKFIKILFDADIKYNNTKPQPLINSGLFIRCDEIHGYLLNLDISLQIKQWMDEERKITEKITGKTGTKNGGKFNSMKIINKLKSKLDEIIKRMPVLIEKKDIIKEEINQIQVRNIKNCHLPICHENIRMLHLMENNNNNNNNNQYGGYHAASFNVSDARYSPLPFNDSNICELINIIAKKRSFIGSAK